MNAVDTNVPIYALDSNELVKGEIAQALLDRLEQEDTVLLWQVACEFSAAAIRMFERGILHVQPIVTVDALRKRFPLVSPDPAILDIALELRRDRQVAFWDAMLIAACLSAGVDTLYTEDVPGSRAPAGLKIVNPFV